MFKATLLEGICTLLEGIYTKSKLFSLWDYIFVLCAWGGNFCVQPWQMSVDQVDRAVNHFSFGRPTGLVSRWKYHCKYSRKRKQSYSSQSSVAWTVCFIADVSGHKQLGLNVLIYISGK